MTQRYSKKRDALALLYRWCRYRKNLVFDNSEVGRVCRKIGFGNQFDVTKLDSSADLPATLVKDDAFPIHLGQPEQRQPARHQFVYGITNGYHEFEPVPPENCLQWRYRRSLLNNINTSESNILSVGYNQRIIHDFLYEDIAASPKVYGSHRTHIPLDYHMGQDVIHINRVQVEIDFTLEHLGVITCFEAKNGEPADFNVFQMFNPYRYYRRVTAGRPVASINCCYLLRSGNRLRLYLYSFTDPQNPGSIRLERNAQYTLVLR